MEIPADLIFANPSLNLSFESDVRLNKTATSIVIEGTRGGFLSLSNALIYLTNALEETIEVHAFSYIHADISLTIEIEQLAADAQFGRIIRQAETVFLWRISESGLCEVASLMHSLGHINDELHLDQGTPLNEITVYCVVA